MARRIRDSGCTSSLGPTVTGAGVVTVEGFGTNGVEVTAGVTGGDAWAALARAMAASMSSRVIRPVAPEPRMAPRSMPCWAASFLTIGESLARPLSAEAAEAREARGMGVLDA